jgi:hypothetical protein
MLRMMYHSALRVNTFVLFERALDDVSSPVRLPPEYKVVRPTTEELEKIRSGRELPREFFCDRFHGVKHCYIVMHGAQPAYIHWIYAKGDANRFLRLDDRVAEINYITTVRQFRGKGMMTTMLLFTMNELKRMGYKKVVSVVNTLNPPAVKSMRAAGFMEAREIRTLGFFNRRYVVHE